MLIDATLTWNSFVFWFCFLLPSVVTSKTYLWSFKQMHVRKAIYGIILNKLATLHEL